MEKTKKETVKDEKSELINSTMKDIRNYFNDKGIIMMMSDQPSIDIQVIPTGSLILDDCLGVGGYPKGRIIEIYGPESSGKTTLALEAIAQVQKQGGKAAFIDAEHAIDPEYSKTLGVNIDDLILSQPDYGEQALEIVNMLASSKAIDLIVVDSVAALVPKAEIEGTMEDNSVGLQARMMSKSLRKLAGVLSKGNCTVIFINQLREKVGVMYGNPETTTGGRALKFYSTIRIEIRRGEQLKEGDRFTGNYINVKVVKNKVAPPYRSCKIELTYGKGIQREHELAMLAIDYGIIEKSGSWFSYNGEKLGQGISTVYSLLQNDESVKKMVEEEVKKHFSKEEKEEN